MAAIKVGAPRCCLAFLTATLATGPTEALGQLTPEDIARVAWIEETAISPDGQWVAYVVTRSVRPGEASRGRARELFVIPAAGGEPRSLASEERSPRAPAWSPDGALVAFVADFPERDPHRQVYGMPREGGEPRALTWAGADVQGFAFSPDGKQLAFLAPEPAPDSVLERERRGYDAVVYGEPGAHVRLWIQSLRGDAARPLTPPNRTVRDLAWSPDGGAFALQVTEGTDWESDWNFRRLYTMPARGGELSLLAPTEGPLGNMAWSPDGAWLAFIGATSLRDPSPQSVFVVPASGGVAADRTVGYEGSAVWVGWLDAETVLFGAIEGTRNMMNRVAVTGGAIEHVLGGGAETFDFLGVDIGTGLSVDARTETFAAPMATATHPDELYVGRTDGRRLRRLTSLNGFIEGIRLARQETIEWEGADGLRIEGILIHPLEEREGVRHPLVVIPHGGPEGSVLDAWIGTGDLIKSQAPAQLFATHGYMVLSPNYRGSIGRGVAFARANQRDLGGRELEDILRGIDHLVAQGLVDPDRVAIQGVSYGGYLAALAAGLHSDRFKAAIASAPPTNWVSYIGSSESAIHTTLSHWDLWWYDHPGLLWDRSPVAHVHRNWAPLHIDHGMLDEVVPYLQSKELYQALRWAGAEVRLVLYPREGHNYVEEAHQIDVMRRFLEWLDLHLSRASVEGG